MSDIAQRFRPRLGPDWPAPLPKMLDAAQEQEAHHPESLIGRILQQWAMDEEVGEELRAELDADSLAFVLSDRHGGEWGKTHFGPWGSGTTESGEVFTAPSRERLTADAVMRWRERAEQVDHHIARARYSDAAWDLAPSVGVKRDRADAIRAIDSYIGQCEKSRSELHIESSLNRAAALAASIGDQQRADNVRTSLLELCRIEDSEGCERLRFLACDLYVLEKASDATEDEKANVIGWMEAGLTASVDRGDPFDGERYFERLDLHYRKAGDTDARKRVGRAFGGLLESWAAKGNGMLAMHNYKRAHEVYQATGLRDEALAVRARVQDATARSKDEMARFSTTVEVPVEKMAEFVRGIVSGDWPQVLIRFVAEFLHRRAEFEKQLQSWLDGSTMYGLMGQTVITASGDSVQLQSPQEDREAHVILKGTEVLRFAELFMCRVLDELWRVHEASPEKLLSVLIESPLIADDRYAILKRALKAYWLRDYTTFITLAVPQVEHGLRLLFRHAAECATTTTRDSKRWRTLTLNQILEGEALQGLLGEDVLLYLRVVLTHDLGMNMRNLVCHGLVGDAWFSRGHADRMMHVLLLLAMLVRPKPDEGGPPPADQSIGDTEI